MKSVKQSPWLILAVGIGVYALVVFHRSSLAVAATEAQLRFGITATQLGSFVTVQLAMAAIMQIPGGILADRFGARRLLIVCTVLVGLSQVTFGLATSFPVALLARGVMGGADTLAFISVMRLAVGWFPPKMFPLTTSLAAMIGMLGAVSATVPLSSALNEWGWTWTFVAVGSVSVAYAVFLLRPAGQAPHAEIKPVANVSTGQSQRIVKDLADAWRDPVTRMAFWLHMATMAAPYTFTLLWGYSYFVQGLGYSTVRAASLLAGLMFATALSNLSIGVIASRWSAWKAQMALGLSGASAVCWAFLILWPGGYPPLSVVIVASIVFAMTAPSAGISFMLVRDVAPYERVSTTIALVAMGGYGCSIVVAFVVGAILDLASSAGTSAVDPYRWAFSLMLGITVLAMALANWWRMKIRRELLRAGTSQVR